ncbi:MAG: three-Cys-motif partner protein TcmP [Myxococcales bacterium]|nr:three-Cys-motif partner protein TcmP [Myxococcales bacterium]
MAPPRSTVWALDPHTRAKHAILRRYLQAWQVILPKGGFQEIAYFDGFAGPGSYSGGEDGSPIIALRIALGLPATPTRIRFVFVEKDARRVEALNTAVASLGTLPAHIDVQIVPSDFETAFADFVRPYEARRAPLPPTFAFIDPFGYSVPFSIVQKVLSYPSCEVLLNFMYEEINRFINPPKEKQQSGNLFEEEQPGPQTPASGRPALEARLDSFFGSVDWRVAIKSDVAAERNRLLHDLYSRQLKVRAAAKYVRSFQMKNDRDVTDYFLFFATKNRLGLQKMKEAMWRVDAGGEFTFSDATDPNQTVLFGEPTGDALRKQLVNRFAGTRATVAEVAEFVLAETAFRETHFKRVLKELEKATPPALSIVRAPAGRKSGTYASEDMLLEFTK